MWVRQYAVTGWIRAAEVTHCPLFNGDLGREGGKKERKKERERQRERERERERERGREREREGGREREREREKEKERKGGREGGTRIIYTLSWSAYLAVLEDAVPTEQLPTGRTGLAEGPSRSLQTANFTQVHLFQKLLMCLKLVKLFHIVHLRSTPQKQWTRLSTVIIFF